MGYWMLDVRYTMRDNNINYPKHKMSKINEFATVGAWHAMPIIVKSLDIIIVETFNEKPL